MNIKKIKALAFIGWHVVTHFFKKIIPQANKGLPKFLKNYQNDGVFAISPSVRQNMPSFSQCYFCKLCDTVCPDLITHKKILAPSYIVSAFSRSLTDYRYFESQLTCQNCQECETICPQDVPIKTIVEFMQNKAQEIKTK